MADEGIIPRHGGYEQLLAFQKARGLSASGRIDAATWAALRAARANRLQTSMNLAYGSALASIGLTIPVVVCASIFLDLPLLLGVRPKELVLLALTFMVSTLTLSTGRTHVLQGVVHLVIFAAFLFLSFFP